MSTNDRTALTEAKKSRSSKVIRSLAAIVDSVEEGWFFGRKVATSVLLSAAREMASRQGLPGSYARMFAPTGLDFRRGYRVFTGEPMRSRAGVAHILGEECCRLLLDVKVRDRSVSAALARTENGMLERLNSPESMRYNHVGFYCCGICTVSFWRNLAVGGLDRPGPRFKDGLQVLAGSRADNGRWGRFPFFYTLLALTEIDVPAARSELRWARPAVERSLKAMRGTGRYTQRRRAVLEHALERAA